MHMYIHVPQNTLPPTATQYGHLHHVSEKIIEPAPLIRCTTILEKDYKSLNIIRKWQSSNWHNVILHGDISITHCALLHIPIVSSTIWYSRWDQYMRGYEYLTSTVVRGSCECMLPNEESWCAWLAWLCLPEWQADMVSTATKAWPTCM